MNRLLQRLILYFLFLLVFGCSSDTDFSQQTSANTPMDPFEALAYVNIYQAGRSNAVSGVNAPIYIRFAGPLIPATVNPLNIKVFQISADSASPTATENNRLGFTDITGMFSFQYQPGSSDVSLFPNFPLQPATRYVYVVTSRVKDAFTGGSVSGSVYFQALKSPAPLAGPFAPLEPIRANTTDASGNVVFSGYAKVMNDLIASFPTTTVASRNDIALLGRFITTTAGFVAADPANPSASAVPVESALRAFAAGRGLPGGLPGKDWIGTGLNTVTLTTPAGLTPAAYFAAVTGGTVTAPASIGAVVTGKINSADISMNPVVAHDNPNINLQVPFGTYSAATAVTQAFRDPATHQLTGFYYTDRQIPFVYLAPTGTAPAGGWPLVIFQHGINHHKEDVIAVAGTLTAARFAVVAIDLPLHGELALPGHTSGTLWGEDFLSIGAPLATESNIQQAALNLHRLELTVATPTFNPALAGQGFAVLGANAPNPGIKPRFVSLSLGSIVGAYYLAGNTTLNATPGAPPYTQASLDADMKGLLNSIAGRTAYAIRDSADFGPSVNAGLAAKGIATGSPLYQQLFLLTQAVVDPVDPATMTTPLPNFQTADLLPSRLSGRVLVEEATSTSFNAAGVPLNGDLVVPNANTRYFGNALGGRGVLGVPAALAVAPAFDQLSYLTGRIPALFMFTLSGGKIVPKTAPAAGSPTATTPREGYFQFDQPDVSHGFLIDPFTSPVSYQLAQRQMLFFVLNDVVVDPEVVTAGLHAIGPGIKYEIRVPKAMKVFRH